MRGRKGFDAILGNFGGPSDSGFLSYFHFLSPNRSLEVKTTTREMKFCKENKIILVDLTIINWKSESSDIFGVEKGLILMPVGGSYFDVSL